MIKNLTFLSPLRRILCCGMLFVSLPVLAMSQSPEDEPVPVEPVSLEEAKAGKYGQQFENRDPEADAQAAIEKGDLRLLGFALRATSVPGVAAADRQAALDVCGVRLLEGFGDVLRKGQDMTARRLAHAYATRYNLVMVKACLAKQDSNFSAQPE